MVVGWVEPTAVLVYELWSDAEFMNVTVTSSYLKVAYEQCLAYAPSALPTTIPERYIHAQILQAKNLFQNASGATDSGAPDGFTPVRYPMDWQVKNLLRSKRGIGHVG